MDHYEAASACQFEPLAAQNIPGLSQKHASQACVLVGAMDDLVSLAKPFRGLLTRTSLVTLARLMAPFRFDRSPAMPADVSSYAMGLAQVIMPCMDRTRHFQLFCVFCDDHEATS